MVNLSELPIGLLKIESKSRLFWRNQERASIKRRDERSDASRLPNKRKELNKPSKADNPNKLNELNELTTLNPCYNVPQP